MRDRWVHGERGVSRGCGGALLLGVPRLGVLWGWSPAQAFSQKKVLQATVRAATRTTYSWKSTSPSPFSSRSCMIFSTAPVSFWVWGGGDDRG